MNTTLKHILLLIIRILVGAFIAWAGLQKLLNMDATITNMAAYFSLSPFVVWLVSLGELLGGLGILLGVWTQVAAIAVAIIMAGAVYYTKGEMMSPIYLLIGSLVLAYTGAGKYAVKSK